MTQAAQPNAEEPITERNPSSAPPNERPSDDTSQFRWLHGRRPRFSDHAIGLALMASYVALLLMASRHLGMSRDEGFYVDAAQSYSGWFRMLWDTPREAFAQSAIDRFWEANHEHPALPKSLFALSWILHERFHIFPTDSMAFRFPAMAMAGGILWVLYIFGMRVYDRAVGLFAALAFALMPNVFYHAQLNCFDMPIVFMLTWVTYAYYRGLESKRWALVSGALYGLALETKHNAWILPLILVVHNTWFILHHRGQRPWSRLVPWSLLAMALLGPPIFVAAWPWLHHDTWPRVLEYVNFHIHHVHYNFAYFGHTYWKAPEPVLFPWVMTLFTVSTTTILLAVFGLYARFGALLPAFVRNRLPSWSRHARTISDPLLADILLFGCALVPMLVISLPDTPKFGGTKHFHAAYPMLALFAGVGFRGFLHFVRHSEWHDVLLAETKKRSKWRRGLGEGPTALVLMLMLLAPSALGTYHSQPFGIAYYGYLAGGVPGAADYGMMRQFWGYTTGNVAPWLNEHAEQNATVFLCDTVPTAWSMLQRDGNLRRDLGIAWSLESSDYALVHHEHHFVEVDYQIWSVYGRVDPVYVLTYDGVPIVSVYKNPHR